MNTAVNIVEPRIRDIHITEEEITAYLVDGRTISVPIAWSWRLSEATPQQRSNFEIIGEAANRIDPSFRNQHPDIEWKRIRGFRNRIVHDYFGIDYEIVWDIIEFYLDELIENLIKIKAAKNP